MSDDLTVLGPDGIRRSYDEHYDTVMEVEQDPTGAHYAIQNQHARIEELEAKNKLLNEQMAAIEEHGTESLNALPDCLMRLAPALVEVDELRAKLAKAEWMLVEASVQLREGKAITRRNRADLIDMLLAELKGEK